MADQRTKELLRKLEALDEGESTTRLDKLVTTGQALVAEDSVVGIPPIPPGTTLDLTHPTINVPGVPEFTIPDILSVESSGSAVISPDALSTGDWIVIARSKNLLRAYTLDDAPDDDNEPPRAEELALDYMVPTSADFLVPKDYRGVVKKEVTYSAEMASYVRAGFDKQSASLSIPYAAASFERQHKEREAKASSRKTVYMFGSWYFPRAQLFLKKFTKASKRFTAAVEAAVNAKDVAALERVFNTYGRAVPAEVEIGGRLSLVHKEVCDASVIETEVENTIGAAVTAKYNGVQGSVGVGFGNASSTKVTAEQVNNLTSFEAIGGNVILASNPKQWPDTVSTDPNNWAVIGVSKLAPITDWLEPALRARVEKLLPALQVPSDVRAEDHSARADSDGFIFGARKHYKTGRGGLQIVCGTSGSPGLDQGDAVGAGATFTHFPNGDIWIEGASICVPVRKGSHYSVSKWDDENDQGEAASRFMKTETKLTFGQWQTLSNRKVLNRTNFNIANIPPNTQKSDGFIFCSIRASTGERGFISCTVDGKPVGAASVHNPPPLGTGWRPGMPMPQPVAWSPYACFCVPVPRGLSMSMEVTGTFELRAWYLPITSEDLEFGKTERYTVNAFHTAETDGFLNGVVTVRQGNARGMLELYSGRDRNNLFHGVPGAMMAVHQTSNRFIPYASGMLPIRRGYVFHATPRALSADRGHSGATVEAYWTPLLSVA